MRRSLTAVAVIAALVLFLAAIFTVMRSAVRSARQEFTTPHEETVDVAALVTEVRGLDRLETASMRVVHVGTVKQTYDLVPNVLGGDELTLLATGDVIAGVDLSRLSERDAVRGAGGEITLRIPHAQILTTRVDNRATRVLVRKTGMMRREDPQLETRARQHAEAMIRSEALRRGLLPLADRNAASKIAALLHTVGFERIRIETVDEPPPLR